jgi:hypothetical protein
LVAVHTRRAVAALRAELQDLQSAC